VGVLQHELAGRSMIAQINGNWAGDVSGMEWLEVSYNTGWLEINNSQVLGNRVRGNGGSGEASTIIIKPRLQAALSVTTLPPLEVVAFTTMEISAEKQARL